MDTRTGKLSYLQKTDFKEDRVTPVNPNLIVVTRDLTEHEKAAGKIALYSSCGCGSGKKFKFCCKKPAGGNQKEPMGPLLRRIQARKEGR